MHFGINEILLQHLATGSGAASHLRKPELVDLAATFFRARTDIRRLAAAQALANAILARNHFEEFVEIRHVVARQELRRKIKYQRQQDHTAHTVYLYFLGLWFFDHLPQFRTAVKTKFNLVSSRCADAEFLFQWTYASLLHDIGYVFFTLDDDTTVDRQVIDNLYSWEWVEKQYKQMDVEAKRAMQEAFEEWVERHGAGMPSCTSEHSASADSNVKVLERLAFAPWLGDLVPSLAGKDIFAVLDNDGDSIKKYAYEIAVNGYKNSSSACVDHAVASGLLLFQYSTFWYWLMHHVSENNPEQYEKLAENFDYKMENISSSIQPACRAVALHNIAPDTESGIEIAHALTIANEPIAFLEILCDELQRWDRYPAGTENLDDYVAFSQAALESDDVSLVCDGTCDDPRVVYIVQSWKDLKNGDALLEKLQKDLFKRLPEYLKIVRITRGMPCQEPQTFI